LFNPMSLSTHLTRSGECAVHLQRRQMEPCVVSVRILLCLEFSARACGMNRHVRLSFPGAVIERGGSMKHVSTFVAIATLGALPLTASAIAAQTMPMTMPMTLSQPASTPVAAGQPNQSCQAAGSVTPGQAASAPGSAFNTGGVAGTKYAG